MRRSRYVPLVFLVAAGGVLAGCDQAPVGDPLEADYVAIESGGLLSLCAVAPAAKASQVIDVEGGSVSVEGVTLTVPAGAVPAATEFRLHVPSSTHVEVEIHADGQEHYQFLAPVVITMDYSRCEVTSGTLTVWHIDPETKALLENMGGVDDALNQRMTFSTMHLSGYAIAN